MHELSMIAIGLALAISGIVVLGLRAAAEADHCPLCGGACRKPYQWTMAEFLDDERRPMS
jgi:hypothetical protein